MQGGVVDQAFAGGKVGVLPAAVRARLVADVGGGGRDAEPGVAEVVVDLHLEGERVARLREQGGGYDDPVRLLFDGMPGAPAQEAVDGVVLVRFGEGDLVVRSLEAVVAVGETVGPGDQRGAVRAVAHLPGRVGLQHVAVTRPVAADAAADLDDRRVLVTGADLELPAGRCECHDVPFRWMPRTGWVARSTAVAGGGRGRTGPRPNGRAGQPPRRPARPGGSPGAPGGGRCGT